MDRIQITVFSHRRSSLDIHTIQSYFKNKVYTQQYSENWLLYEMGNTKIKVSRTGIVEVSNVSEGCDIKEQLVRFASLAEDIVTNILDSSVAIDIAIYQDKYSEMCEENTNNFAVNTISMKSGDYNYEFYKGKYNHIIKIMGIEHFNGIKKAYAVAATMVT